MNNIPCEVIKDLLPSYIDKITDPVTNAIVDTHLSECEDCKEVYKGMVEKTEEIDACEKQEIDFLKKHKKRIRTVILGFIAALVIILGFLFVTRYMIGTYHSDPDADFFMWDVAVDGNNVNISARVVNDIFKITDFKCEEHDDILEVRAHTVPSGVVASIIYGKEFIYNYHSDGEIKQIVINDRIVWGEGENILMQASKLYQTRHPYIGDMPSNNQTANTLNVSSYLGRYENELETTKQPYIWRLSFLDEMPESKMDIKEADMRCFAYCMLAVIENLDAVEYRYRIGSDVKELRIDSDEATQFLGQDIKSCYDNVSALNELIKKTGLDRYAFGTPYFSFSFDESGDGSYYNGTDSIADKIYVNIVNNSIEELSEIDISVYVDGEIIGSIGMINADESPIRRGQLLTYFFENETLMQKLEKGSTLEIKLSVKCEDDIIYDVKGQIRIPVYNASLHDIHITGDKENGFTVGQ